MTDCVNFEALQSYAVRVTSEHKGVIVTARLAHGWTNQYDVICAYDDRRVEVSTLDYGQAMRVIETVSAMLGGFAPETDDRLDVLRGIARSINAMQRNKPVCQATIVSVVPFGHDNYAVTLTHASQVITRNMTYQFASGYLTRMLATLDREALGL